jgi:DNA polymerase III subunit epsilon
MKIRCFFETDCYNLNQNAYFYYPFQHRLANCLQKVFFPNLSGKNGEERFKKINDTVVKKILHKIDAVIYETNWEQNLEDASYVIFDTETTGLHPLRGDKIISIGGVILEKGLLKDQKFNILVNPGRSIPTTASMLTGITDDMVSDKPTLHEVLPDFLDFIGNRILVAHNAAFDLAFLNIGLSQLAPVRILNPLIDTYLLANFVLPGLQECSLENLVKRFKLDMKERHTALGDSIMTAGIFLNLLKILIDKGIFTLDQLQKFLMQQKNLYLTLSTDQGQVTNLK